MLQNVAKYGAVFRMVFNFSMKRQRKGFHYFYFLVINFYFFSFSFRELIIFFFFLGSERCLKDEVMISVIDGKKKKKKDSQHS